MVLGIFLIKIVSDEENTLKFLREDKENTNSYVFIKQLDSIAMAVSLK